MLLRQEGAVDNHVRVQHQKVILCGLCDLEPLAEHPRFIVQRIPAARKESSLSLSIEEGTDKSKHSCGRPLQHAHTLNHSVWHTAASAATWKWRKTSHRHMGMVPHLPPHPRLIHAVLLQNRAPVLELEVIMMCCIARCALLVGVQ